MSHGVELNSQRCKYVHIKLKIKFPFTTPQSWADLAVITNALPFYRNVVKYPTNAEGDVENVGAWNLQSHRKIYWLVRTPYIHAFLPGVHLLI